MVDWDVEVREVPTELAVLGELDWLAALVDCFGIVPGWLEHC